MIDIRPVQTDAASLGKYRTLFGTCFPGAAHLDEGYLKWLYLDNPEGQVVGFDGWAGDQLCAHYACIPARVDIRGQPARALLSLNTATHPDYQGQGLFTRLAERTYELASLQGYECVYGIANANSTPGFTRKLGFARVGALDARLGAGRVMLRPTSAATHPGSDPAFRRRWSAETFRWRIANPRNPVLASLDDRGWVLASAASRHIGIRAYAELPPVPGLALPAGRQGFALRLFVGAVPASERAGSAYVPVPRILRPSPLNMIFRDLGGRHQPPAMAGVRFCFLDFDAY